ncbi:hypothetical protein [Shimia sp. Alg240-R146]|uniref:hypothetical protein n=1 Tax=Shimia sp. Alg240-R146 TaxID=2993449 RepID=UPI0022E59F51|nr:hypothetical protein [Shimia sp. Alg240-R146]
MKLLVLVILALAPAVQAGPWPRPPGEQFMSVSVEAPRDAGNLSQAFASVYYERGLKRDWTMGFDTGADGLGYRKSYIFLRRPVWKGRSSRVALSLGFGQQSTVKGVGYAVRPELSWGRDLTLLRRSGWLTIDTSAAHVLALQATVIKTEATLGLSWSPKTKTFVQVTAVKETGRAVRTMLTPTMAFQIRENMHLVGAAVLSPDQRTKLKLGLWVTF